MGMSQVSVLVRSEPGEGATSSAVGAAATLCSSPGMTIAAEIATKERAADASTMAMRALAPTLFHHQQAMTMSKLTFAHFSDRGHLFQADRGRRFRAIVDAQGMRASEGLNVSQSSKRSEATHREAACWIATSQTYPRRRAALATYRPTRWVSRLGH